jgi:hypothetical protein
LIYSFQCKKIKKFDFQQIIPNEYEIVQTKTLGTGIHMVVSYGEIFSFLENIKV